MDKINLDFSNLNVLVIGDVMLDFFYYGNVSRISPEAPVPVVNVKKTEYHPGGAANVAVNISELGGKAILFGCCGDDHNSVILDSLLEKHGIVNSLVKSESPTITKTRVIGDHQQIVRLDIEESGADYSGLLTAEFDKKFNSFKEQKIDIIVLSDYAKGVCSTDLCRKVIDKAVKENIPVIVDPKGTEWEKYRGSYLITPNFREFREITGKTLSNTDSELEKNAYDVVKRFGFKNLLITRSENGMSCFSSDSYFHIHTEAKEVFDVSGAGDTVIAALSLSLCRNSLENAVVTANKAAGIVVGKLGTASATKDELYRAVTGKEESKLIPLADLNKKIEQLRKQKKKIVFTNGCFDLVHAGHIKVLREAKKMGDILLLGLNSDDSIKRLKGEDRPVNCEEDRVTMISSFSFVDYVVVFDSDTPIEIIKNINPDILVKGGDYTVETVVGYQYAKEVRLINFLEGYSSTNIIKKIREDK